MKNALLKDTFREIKRTKSRFISIFMIVVLGVAFFAGIKATCPDMKITADNYFDEYRLMDMRLVSTIGFNNKDVDIIKDVSGAEGIFPTYSMDALVNTEDRNMVFKVLTLPMDKIKNPDESYINRTKLVEGRYPEKAGECVTEKSTMTNSGLSIGSKIKLSSGTDEDIHESLKNDEFIIVGMVETPYYISFERGTTNIGNGKIDSFIMIPEENFKIPAYTDVFLTFKEAREVLCYDEEYDNILQPIKKKLDKVGDRRVKERYDEIKLEANEKLNERKKELEELQKKADKEFKEARQKNVDGEKKIVNGKKKLLDEERKFKRTIKEAEMKIADAEAEIKKMEEPDWYVIKRNQTLDFIDYEMAADRIDAIAKVFPAFFFLIAALVCLTTMTRMVDEQRTYIGTLKALGYNKVSIASKYILYAGIASISGSIFGALIGFKVFPTIIFNAYRIMYIMPPIVTEFNVLYAIISISFAVVTTTLAAWISCYRELKETPALLMRPKVQKSGKRIFLEKIKFIWSRFNFTQKVTARNLIRYKKRLFMTILGVGGCTALMLAGFGLKDSIVSIATKQFDELYQYDMTIGLKESISSEERTKFTDDMKKSDKISDFMLINEQNIDVGAGNKRKNAFLIIPEKPERLKDFITLRSRTTGKEVPFNDKGVVLTEKLAKMLQVEVGDEIYIKDADNKKTNVKVTGITENYVSHYIYISPKLFENTYKKKVEYKEFIAKTTNTSKNFENKLSTEILKNPEISSVSFITGASDNFKDMIGSLNYVVLVLIISAGALAFVVLYNLTNVNVSERLREIATIKVLGFYDKEVSSYVYRENTILTIVGIVLGLIMGIFLHRFIILTGEIDYIMFGRSIEPISYIYAAILTVVFAVLVSFVMHFKLKEIEMVESLKSVE